MSKIKIYLPGVIKSAAKLPENMIVDALVLGFETIEVLSQASDCVVSMRVLENYSKWKSLMEGRDVKTRCTLWAMSMYCGWFYYLGNGKHTQTK